MLAIWARSDDVMAAHVRAAAEARGEKTVIVPADAPDDAEANDANGGACGVSATDLSSWLIAGADLDEVTAQLLLALPSAFVTARDGDGPSDVARRAFEAEERRQLALAAFIALEERGARTINPSASLAFEPKPRQLDALARAGLPVPATMITSMPLAALKFVDALAAEGKAAIVKPMIGGATARLVDAHVRGALLEQLATTPVIVQERIAGDDVRVTVIDGRVVSAVVIESAALDYRDDPTYRAGQARYVPIELPPAVAELALRAASVCRHALSGVDLKRAPARTAGAPAASAGEQPWTWTVLECNAAPRFLDIELRAGHPLTHALLDALLPRPAR